MSITRITSQLKKNLRITALIAVVLVALVTIIGKGGGDAPPAEGGNGGNGGGGTGTTTTGVFIDAFVQGMDFESRDGAGTVTHSGTTNSAGEFLCESEDTVAFSLADGAIQFGAAPCSVILTPADLVNAMTPPPTDRNRTLRNVLRWIQTLDIDGDPNNGITLPSIPSQLVTELFPEGFTLVEYDRDELIFASDADFRNLLSQVTNTSNLIDGDTAEQNFNMAIAGLENYPDPREGWDDVPDTAEGLWQGTTSDDRTISGVIFENGNYWFVSSPASDPDVPDGLIQGSGIILELGSFDSDDGISFELNAGSTDVTIAANYVAGQTWNGTMFSPDGGQLEIDLDYFIRRADPDLFDIAGDYIGPAVFAGSPVSAEINISATGGLNATTDAGDCTFSGSVSPHPSGLAYDVTNLTFAGVCSAIDPMDGVIWVDPINLSLYITAINADRTDEFYAQTIEVEVDNPTTWTANAAPVFVDKCSPCHTSQGMGGHNIATNYADASKPAVVFPACTGLTVGRCTIVLIQSGVMPYLKGCTGIPLTDASNPDCLNQAEQDIIQDWIDDGLLE